MGTIYKQGEYYSGGGGNVSSLNDIEDVTITNPQDNEVLSYNATSKKWENSEGGGGSFNKMSENDVDDIKDSFAIQASKAVSIQYSTMPEPIPDKEGWIVQYVGATDTFINGYFYECKETAPSTYSWVEKQVQQGGGESGLPEGVVAEEFNPENSYSENDYCTKENVLYKFNKDHTGAWNINDVDEVNVMGEIPVTMTNDDVEDIKESISIIPMEIPQAMSPTDVEDIKDAFDVEKSSSVPVGTIIDFLGVYPPQNYLECDGTIYNIEDYRNLAEHINSQFGNYSYFGGDGVTTFAVPNRNGLTDSIYCIYFGL